MNLEFFVQNRKLTWKGCSAVVADTASCDTFTIDFDREWDGLIKVVVLQNGGNTAQMIYTGKTAIPRQVCGRGDLYLSCHGYRTSSDAVAVVRTLPMIRPVRMAAGAQQLPGAGQPEAAPIYEQMLALVQQAQSAARQAEETTQQLLEMKDSGAFTGPAGQNATIQIHSVSHGSPARVENLGTQRNALLRFVLPYRLSQQELGELVLQIRQGAIGEIDAALEQILAIQQSLMEEVEA